MIAPRLDPEFEVVRAAVGKDAGHMEDDAVWYGEALDTLDSIQAELTRLQGMYERLRLENERLQGFWTSSEGRCPQCGTGFEGSPLVRLLREEGANLRREVERLTVRNNRSNYHEKMLKRQVIALKGEVTILKGQVASRDETLDKIYEAGRWY